MPGALRRRCEVPPAPSVSTPRGSQSASLYTGGALPPGAARSCSAGLAHSALPLRQCRPACRVRLALRRTHGPSEGGPLGGNLTSLPPPPHRAASGSARNAFLAPRGLRWAYLRASAALPLSVSQADSTGTALQRLQRQGGREPPGVTGRLRTEPGDASQCGPGIRPPWAETPCDRPEEGSPHPTTSAGRGRPRSAGGAAEGAGRPRCHRTQRFSRPLDPGKQRAGSRGFCDCDLTPSPHVPPPVSASSGETAAPRPLPPLPPRHPQGACKVAFGAPAPTTAGRTACHRGWGLSSHSLTWATLSAFE